MEEKRGSLWREFIGTLAAAGLTAVVLAVLWLILMLALIGAAVVYIVIQVNRMG